MRNSLQRVSVVAFTLARLAAVIALAGLGLGYAGKKLTDEAGRTISVVSIPTQEKINLSDLSSRSIVYDRHGAEIAVFHAAEDREVIPLAQIPKPLQDAVVAVEDRTFWEHEGINGRAILRAVAANAESAETSQGGSTITQQLVKNLLLGPEVSIERKIKEASLAIQIEQKYSKAEILEKYLNEVYFGNGAYGVQSAAQTYFNYDSVQQLNWADIALLVSIIPSPNNNEPIENPENATERRRVVANRMHELKVIDDATLAEVLAYPLPTQTFQKAREIAQARVTTGSNYFVEEVRRQMEAHPAVGPDLLYKGGLRIYTTFDPRAQEQAEAAVDRGLPNTRGRFAAALAAVEPGLGAVRALVGGEPGRETDFNLATQARRQPGSSFKPIVLAAAFEDGYVPNDTINGSGPCSFNVPGQDPYTAENYEGSAGATTSLTEQTVKSNNCAFLRLQQHIGTAKVIAMAHSLGLNDMVEGITSTAIGTQVVTPLSMAAAFAAFASDGIYRAPYLVERITDSSGIPIYQQTDEPIVAMSPASARLITQTLIKNVQGGTGEKAAIRGVQVAGKTGTTNDYADAWFVGYTPRLATAVWMGSPKGTVDKMTRVGGIRVTGGTFPAQIWRGFMAAYHDGLPPARFPSAPGTRSGRYIGSGSSKSSSSRSSSSRSSSRSTTTVATKGRSAED